MVTIENVFQRLWESYVAVAPQALKIEELFRSRGDRIKNDHVALRTFDHDLVGLETIDRVFLEIGYEPAASYEFPEKKLFAYHYEHESRDAPKIFISALAYTELSKSAQGIIDTLIAQVSTTAIVEPFFISSGRHWEPTLAQYEELLAESEYAAWLAAFGFRANHFTVSVNHLSSVANIRELNQVVKTSGFALNESGGEVKGGKEQLLAQSSTLAETTLVKFQDAETEIPSCYYEFAERFRDESGELFQGFIAGSADKIFESTDRKK